MSEERRQDEKVDFPEVEESEVEPRGWQFGWLWILLVVFFAALLWFGGWGWGGHGGWLLNHRMVVENAVPKPTAAVVNTQVEGAGLPILEANDKRQYVNKVFAISNAVVETKPGAATFWIGTQNSAPAVNVPPMLVVMMNSAVPHPPVQGERVAVTGAVRKAPTEAVAEKDWSLSSADASQLEKEGVYIQATEVKGAA